MAGRFMLLFIFAMIFTTLPMAPAMASFVRIVDSCIDTLCSCVRI